MAKRIYIGVNGVARKAYKAYFGVNDVARKVRKAYIGIGGVARPFMASAEVGDLIRYGSVTDLSTPRGYMATGSTSAHAFFGAGHVYDHYNTYKNYGFAVVDAYNSALTRITATALTGEGGAYVGAYSESNYMLFFGGQPHNYVASNVLHKYDKSCTQSIPGYLHAAVYGAAGAKIGNYVLIGGGVYATLSPINKTLVAYVNAFNSSFTQSLAPNLSVAKHQILAGTAKNKCIFYGGYNNLNMTTSYNTGSIDAYDSSLTLTSTTSSILVNAIANPCLSYNDYFIYAGPYVSGGGYAVYAYDSSLTHSMPARTAKPKINGKVCKFGKYAVFVGPDGSVEAFDAAFTRQIADPLVASCNYFSAAAIGDYMLVAGGWSGYTDKVGRSSVEAYTILKSVEE